jgi:DNA-binding transcriptional ArsR family regulator
MEYFIDTEKKRILPAKSTDAEIVAALDHPIRQRIIHELAKRSTYPLELARKMKMHEQKLYYHIRILQKTGLLKKVGRFYEVQRNVLCYVPEYVEPIEGGVGLQAFVPVPEMMKPFVKDGVIDCKIVVGAPFPHGPLNRAARSGHLAGEVAALLGWFGRVERRFVYLDTEMADLKGNIIAISGMRVNTAMQQLNEYLPIRFCEEGHCIVSSITEEHYRGHDTGMIVRMLNPFSKGHYIIVLAGISTLGTRAAVVAFTQHFDRVLKGNAKNPTVFANVVRGKEVKGRVDAEFLE